jgi:3-hydroxy-9,10-secoandrosta-1,3,5(10)-triene-9,17-dione monooxygenase
MIQVAARMAMQATSELFASSSSSAAKRGTRMQRYYRDASAYIGHISARHDIIAADVARVHFGLPDGLF